MKKIFTLIAAAFLGGVIVNAQTRTPLWEGEYTFDETWSGSQSVDKEKFATAKAGDKLVVTAEPVEPDTWQWGAQVFIKTRRENWDEIASTINVDKAGEFSVIISDDEITLKTAQVTTTMLSELQNQGLVIQGIDAKITKVELETSIETSATQLAFTGGHTILSSEFDNYPDDYQVKISIANNTDPYVSRNGWGIGGFSYADNWPSDYTAESYAYAITGLDGSTFDIYVTVGDFKTAAKNGTDEYVVGKDNGTTGVTFNIYNGCKITGVYVLVPTGISETIATPVAKTNANAPMYNLAGQQVTKSYKGVVIQNGKKFMNK